MRPVKVETLIEKIYVSPLAPHWFENVVREAVVRFDSKADVLHSAIAEVPFF